MDRRRVPKIFAGVAFDRMNPPKRVKLESFGASKVQIEELSIENEKLKEENERLRATIGDLDDQVFRMRSAFHRCQSFDAGLAGKTKEERSCFRTTTGLSPPSFIKLCNVCADDLPSRLNGSWEESVFFALHRLRTGLSFHLMQSEYMESASTLSRRYRETVELLGSKLSARFREDALSDFRPEDLLKHTPAKWKKAFPAYQYVVVVDVTEVYVPKSGDRYVSRATYSQYKHGHCDAMIRLTALDGYVLYNGGFDGGAEPRDYANLDVRPPSFLHSSYLRRNYGFREN
jgi:hypothetical protein